MTPRRSSVGTLIRAPMNGRLLAGLDLPERNQPPKMIYSQADRRATDYAPAVESTRRISLFEHIPAIDGVAPELACRAEESGGPRQQLQGSSRVQLEELGPGPDIGTVVVDIDGQVSW